MKNSESITVFEKNQIQKFPKRNAFREKRNMIFLKKCNCNEKCDL